MSVISIQDINKLRSQSGLGLTDCKKALTESEGDFQKAIEYLRKKGQKLAIARSDKEAKEGVVLACSTDDYVKAYLICVACETDFVAKNENFVEVVKEILSLGIQKKVSSVAALQEVPFEEGGITVAQKIQEEVGKIGENIFITSYKRLEADTVISYVHGAYRIGVLVGINQPFSKVIEQTGKNIAMQIAAMKPLAVDELSMDVALIDKEKAIIKQLLADDPKMQGKPEWMLDKIVEGKLASFMKENTLLAQPYVKDNRQTVGKYLNSINKALKITAFHRVAVGG